MKQTIFATVLGAALSAGMVFAQAPATPGQPGSRHQAGRRQQPQQWRMLRALNLTDAQKLEIRQIFQDSRAANADVRKQLQTQRASEREAIKSGAPAAQLEALASEAAPLLAKVEANRLVTQSRIYAVLTPEQREQAERMRSRSGNRSSRPQNQ